MYDLNSQGNWFIRKKLLESMLRLRKEQYDAQGHTNGYGIDWWAIADALGVPKEHQASQFQKMLDEGIIVEVTRTKVRLTDLGELQANAIGEFVDNP